MRSRLLDLMGSLWVHSNLRHSDSKFLVKLMVGEDQKRQNSPMYLNGTKARLHIKRLVAMLKRLKSTALEQEQGINISYLRIYLPPVV